jgi:hypothetical protein
MKKIILLGAMLLSFAICGFAQTYNGNFSACSVNYHVMVEEQNDNSIKVTVKSGSDDKEIFNYKIWARDDESFAKAFVAKFIESVKPSDDCKKKELEQWMIYGRQLLQKYQTELNNILPKAGKFKVFEDVSIYKYMKDRTKNPIPEKLVILKSDEKYKVINMSAEIVDGYMENVKVVVEKANMGPYDRQKTFTIPYPVGMSSFKNFRAFSNRYLYDTDKSPYDEENFFIKLGELISYSPEYSVERRDYSPKDTSINNLQAGSSLMLHKEESKKLFEVNIFSDFQGFNEAKPNGLLQFDLSKRINVNTIQYPSTKGLNWLFTSFGFSQYISPAVSVQKLEEHNKKLNLLDLDSVRLNPGTTDVSILDKNHHRYATALALFQYQWLSVGTDLNVFYLNNQSGKFNICFNAGFRFGFTDTVDSLTTIKDGAITKTKFVKDISVSNFQVYPEIRLKFMPDERFNFTFSNRWLYFKSLNPAIQMVNYDKDDLSKIVPKTSTWFNTAELLMTIKVNEKSKVFGRFRMNWELDNIKNNFSQIQVGYSTYIFGTKK